jgi:hypothetical protein
VQDVFGSDGFLADTAFGEGDVLGDRAVEMMADHQHVEMFGDGVDGVGPGRVGRGRQHVAEPADLDDVGRVAAAGTLGVEGVDGAALQRLDGAFDKAALVERIGVDHHLDIILVGHRETCVDGSWRGAPILMQFERTGAAEHHFLERGRHRGIALARKSQIHREGVGALDHPGDVPGAGRAGGGKRAMRRAGAAAEHGGQTAHQGFFNLLRADVVDVAVETACGEDLAFAGNCLGAGAHDDVHTWLGVGIACLTDGGDAAVLEPDIGLVNAGVIDHQRIGDDGVDGAIGAGDLGLPHAVTDHLAAAEFHFLAIGCEILLDLDEEFGVGKAHLVADGRTIHGGIG